MINVHLDFDSWSAIYILEPEAWYKNMRELDQSNDVIAEAHEGLKLKSFKISSTVLILWLNFRHEILISQQKFWRKLQFWCFGQRYLQQNCNPVTLKVPTQI